MKSIIAKSIIAAALLLLPSFGYAKDCCKTCGPTSKPCGDSCIGMNKTCSKPAGCACENPTAVQVTQAPTPVATVKVEKTAPAVIPAPSTSKTTTHSDTCCKHCSKGVPCGNSCIAAGKTCHITGGCAC